MVSKVFVDSDVLLDLFLLREPHLVYTQELLSLRNPAVRLFTSSVIINNLYYFIAKERGKPTAKTALNSLLKLINVLPVTQNAIELALESDFNDFEDALQYFTAIEHGCQRIITRNLKHYKKSYIPALTAQDFLKTL